MREQAFPRDLAALEPIYAFVRTALRDWGIPEDRAWDIDLVLEELFTNVVKYGRSSAKPVTLSLDWSRPALTMRLRDDDAEFFDPTRSPEPDTSQPILARRAGGLGLHFVRQVADRFEYSYEKPVGTLTVTLRLES